MSSFSNRILNLRILNMLRTARCSCGNLYCGLFAPESHTCWPMPASSNAFQKTQLTTDTTLGTQSLAPEDPIPLHIFQLSNHHSDFCRTFISLSMGFLLTDEKDILQRKKTAIFLIFTQHRQLFLHFPVHLYNTVLDFSTFQMENPIIELSTA